MINELMKRLSELPNVTLSDGQEYIQLYDAMETVKRALEQEPKYCDRSICLRNEYSNIGCEECEVTKSQESIFYPQVDGITPTVVKQEPSGDLISRQAVMDYIHRILNQGTGKKKSFKFIQKYVEKLSSVKPQEPKTAYWIRLNDYTDEKDKHKCSNCGFESIGATRFCPNCGCRMVEPQESDHTCKHYTSGERDGSCGSYICKGYSNDAVSKQAVLEIVEREQFKGDAISEIEKLPSINQQPCEDAVDRQWLMRKATERFYTTNYFNHITKMIEEAPSVNPQPKTGCEGCTYEKTGNNSTYPCSHCGRCYTDKYKAESEE